MNEPAAEWVDLDDLKPWADNPRRNDHAVAMVARSIERFGFGAPIVARMDGTLIAGHTRWKAARQLGLERVPVRYMDLSDTEAAAMALADNKLGEEAEWDPIKLEELSAVVELAEVGFKDWELAEILGEHEQPGDDGFGAFNGKAAKPTAQTLVSVVVTVADANDFMLAITSKAEPGETVGETLMRLIR